jgi:hypothetical protein
MSVVPRASLLAFALALFASAATSARAFGIEVKPQATECVYAVRGV